MTNELVIMGGQQQEMFLPIMNVELAIQRRDYLVKFVSQIMKEGHDFGKIPGTGDKPTLLKPGAEKLATFFGLTPVFIPVSVTEDWTGEQHGGEAFFYYRYKCELWRVGNLIATAEASCNSRESKYRYRKGERVCPTCGQPCIRKGSDQYGGGWYCHTKSGGCNAKFPKGDQRIEAQEVGRVPNPDVADLVNTIQKMSQKRAMVAAILLAVNASEFFTQDIEDLAENIVEGTYTVVEQPAKKQAPPPAPSTQHRPPPAKPNKPAPTPEPPEMPPTTNGAHQTPVDDILSDKTVSGDVLAFVGELRSQERPGAKKASEKQHQYGVSIIDGITGEQTHRQVFKAIFNRDVTKDEPLGLDAFKLILKHLSKQKSIKGDDSSWVNVENTDYDQAKVNMVKVIHGWAMEARGQMTIAQTGDNMVLDPATGQMVEADVDRLWA